MYLYTPTGRSVGMAPLHGGPTRGPASHSEDRGNGAIEPVTLRSTIRVVYTSKPEATNHPGPYPVHGLPAMSAYPSTERKKNRRNVSLPPELDDWLSSDDVENASELIADLLMAYRAYGGDTDRAARYVLEKEAALSEN